MVSAGGGNPGCPASVHHLLEWLCTGRWRCGPRALRGTKKRLSLRSPYGEPRTDVNVCGATLIAALSQPRPLSRMPTHPRLCNGRPPLRNTGPSWPFILTLSGPFVQSVSRRALSAAGSLWGRAWFYLRLIGLGLLYAGGRKLSRGAGIFFPGRGRGKTSVSH